MRFYMIVYDCIAKKNAYPKEQSMDPPMYDCSML